MELSKRRFRCRMCERGERERKGNGDEKRKKKRKLDLLSLSPPVLTGMGEGAFMYFLASREKETRVGKIGGKMGRRDLLQPRHDTRRYACLICRHRIRRNN